MDRSIPPHKFNPKIHLHKVVMKISINLQAKPGDFVGCKLNLHNELPGGKDETKNIKANWKEKK